MKKPWPYAGRMWLLLKIFVILYLTASNILGLVSLLFLNIAPEQFDAFRSNDPWERAKTVAGVMLLGPFTTFMAIMGV